MIKSGITYLSKYYMMQVLEASISRLHIFLNCLQTGQQRDCVKINNKMKRHVLIYSS